MLPAHICVHNNERVVPLPAGLQLQRDVANCLVDEQNHCMIYSPSLIIDEIEAMFKQFWNL
eukprot:SAG31_NODE_1073_length_10065_cov_2.176701_1_plen_61_part_00